MLDEATASPAVGPRFDGRVRRLTPLQRALLAYMAERGGAYVYLSPCTRAVGHLRGYTWEGVHLSLQSLLRAGLIQKSERNNGFWSLTPNYNSTPR